MTRKTVRATPIISSDPRCILFWRHLALGCPYTCQFNIRPRQIDLVAASWQSIDLANGGGINSPGTWMRHYTTNSCSLSNAQNSGR